MEKSSELSLEEKKERVEQQKNRILSDAELVKEGAEVNEKGEILPSSEQKQEIKEEMQTKNVVFENQNGDSLIFETKVEKKKGKVTKFLDDISGEIPISYDQNFCDNLFQKIGTVVDGAEWEGWKSKDGEDLSGELYIPKESLNKALQEGKLKIREDEEGDLVLE